MGRYIYGNDVLSIYGAGVSGGFPGGIVFGTWSQSGTKRHSMIGDGLSCWIRGAGDRGCANMAPLAAVIPVVVVAAVLLLRISGSKIKGDAAIALISTGALAIGIMVIS